MINNGRWLAKTSVETPPFLWPACPALAPKAFPLSAERDWDGCTLQSKQAALLQSSPPAPAGHCPALGKHLAQPGAVTGTGSSGQISLCSTCWIWASRGPTPALGTATPQPPQQVRDCGNPVQASSLFAGKETKPHFCFRECAGKKVLIRAS